MFKISLICHLAMIVAFLATASSAALASTAASANRKKLMNNYDFTKVVAYIESELAKGTFPGASLIVDHHGMVVFQQNWGTYCSPTRRDTPVDNNVSHMLYSVSKGISATVIVIAHQQGLIDYDAPLYTYIPEYRGKWKDTCTIRHLLTHSAGIPNCALKAVDTPDAWENAVAVCCTYAVEWEPGSRTAYHATTGMLLVSEAVRRASGLPTWEAVCRKLLFDPLDAKSLTFIVPEQDVQVALTPQPAALSNPPKNPCDYCLLPGHPGGGCVGKVEDVLKVLRLNLNDGMYNGKRLIDEEEMQEMHRIQYEKQIAEAEAKGAAPTHEPWGLGWLVKRNLKNHWFGFGDLASPKAFGHAGISTVITVAEPERDFALVFLTTDVPKPPGTDPGIIRNKVTDMVTEAIIKSNR